MGNILITGACGQLGLELTLALRKAFGDDKVIASDISKPMEALLTGPFVNLDVLNTEEISDVLDKFQIKEIYHLAAILSATGEQNPRRAWHLNMEGLINVLDYARDRQVQKVFWPSSIAVFGPSTPKINTPQKSILDPTTMYGISKLAGEKWCEYYYHKYGLDVRSLRYPGLVSYKAAPGGGTTDFAVDIFKHAVKGQSYQCFLRQDTTLPLLYMPDAVKATLDLMETEASRITVRDSYNIGGINCSPGDLSKEIVETYPDFKITYQPDYRQNIAESWTESVDDGIAREDWGFRYSFDLKRMVKDMLQNC